MKRPVLLTSLLLAGRNSTEPLRNDAAGESELAAHLPPDYWQIILRAAALVVTMICFLTRPLASLVENVWGPTVREFVGHGAKYQRATGTMLPIGMEVPPRCSISRLRVRPATAATTRWRVTGNYDDAGHQ